MQCQSVSQGFLLHDKYKQNGNIKRLNPQITTSQKRKMTHRPKKEVGSGDPPSKHLSPVMLVSSNVTTTRGVLNGFVGSSPMAICNVYSIPAGSNHGVLKVRLEENNSGEENEGVDSGGNVNGRTMGRRRKQRGRPRVSLLPLPRLNTNNTAQTTDDSDNNGCEYDEPEPTPETTTLTRRRTKDKNTTTNDTIDCTRWMWYSGALGSRPTDTANNDNDNDNDTSIYCIPSNADRVLKIYIATHRG